MTNHSAPIRALGLTWILTVMFAAFVVLLVAGYAAGDDRRPVDVHIVRAFTVRDGYGMSTLANIISDRAQFTLKCGRMLDPGNYHAERTDDRMWLTVYDLHEHAHTEKCEIIARSWVRPLAR